MSIAIQSQKGFTLVEMAVVLLIIGLLLGGLLMPLSEQVNSQRYGETREHSTEQGRGLP